MSDVFDAIVAEGDPDDSRDDKVEAEEKATAAAPKKMTAGEREQFMTDGFISHLKEGNAALKATKEILVADRNELRNEVRKLRVSQLATESERASLIRARYSMRVTVGVCSFGGLIGGSLISQFAGNSQSLEWAYLGWGLVLMGGAVATFKMYVDG
ncbi:hypothetical protein GC176_18720 [bacterium]|nr:hypothetical protein [bacterium]